MKRKICTFTAAVLAAVIVAANGETVFTAAGNVQQSASSGSFPSSEGNAGIIRNDDRSDMIITPADDTTVITKSDNIVVKKDSKTDTDNVDVNVNDDGANIKSNADDPDLKTDTDNSDIKTNTDNDDVSVNRNADVKTDNDNITSNKDTVNDSVETAPKPVGKMFWELYPDIKVEYNMPEGNFDDPDIIHITSINDYYKMKSSSKEVSAPRAVSLPKKADNSKSKYFPAIGDQMGFGSCTCWSTVYYQFTYTFNKSRDITTTPENSFSPKFVYNMLNGGSGDNGTFSGDAYSVLKKYGALTMSELPYDDVDSLSVPVTEEAYKAAAQRRLKSYYDIQNVGYDGREITSVDDPDLLPIKTALASGEILTYSTNIYSWRSDELKQADDPNINNGVVGEKAIISCDGTEGGHSMTIVGYDDTIWTDINGNDVVDEGEMGALKIANSWNESSYNKGFAWISYDALNSKSCVENAYNSIGRVACISNVCGVEVLPASETPHRFLTYTVYTDDRFNTNVYLSVKWANQTLKERLDPLMFSFAPLTDYYGYDGKPSASYATVAVEVGYLLDKLGCPEIDEAEWNITLSSASRGHDITMEAIKIYDEQTGQNIAIDCDLPFTATTGKSVERRVHKSSDTNAIIYYRGFKNPVIHYCRYGSTESFSEPMRYTTEEYGYVYKSVIKVGKENDNMRIWFSDEYGRIDDNHGMAYTADIGLNYFVTHGYGDPVSIEYSTKLRDNIDVGCTDSITVHPTGGYEPYKMRYSISDRNTGNVLFTSDYRLITDSNNTQSMGCNYDYAGNLLVTIFVKDSAGTVSSTSYDIDIVDNYLTYSDFHIENLNYNGPLANGRPAKIVAETINDSAVPGECFHSIRIYKDGKTILNKNSSNIVGCSINSKMTFVNEKWTPPEPGVYSAVISRTDRNGEYASRQIYFNVTENEDFRIISDGIISPDEICIGDRVNFVPEVVSRGDFSSDVQYKYSYICEGSETIVRDFSSSPYCSYLVPLQSGPCRLVLTIKSGETVASYEREIEINKPYIDSLEIEENPDNSEASFIIKPDIQHLSVYSSSPEFRYDIISESGQEYTLSTNSDKTAGWTPSSPGNYTIRLTLFVNDELIACKHIRYVVA